MMTMSRAIKEAFGESGGTLRAPQPIDALPVNRDGSLRLRKQVVDSG